MSQKSVVRVGTLLAHGQAPVTRIDCSPGLTSRSPATLRTWFCKQFGKDWKITGWKFKLSAGLVQVIGIIEEPVMQPAAPRAPMAAKPQRISTPKAVAPAATPSTDPRKKHRWERRQAPRKAAAMPAALPKKPTVVVAKAPGSKPRRMKATKPKSPPAHATTAQVLVIAAMNDSFAPPVLGFIRGQTIADNGVSKGRLMQRSRQAIQAYGVTSGKVLAVEIHPLACTPQTRVVVVFASAAPGVLYPLDLAGKATKGELRQWLTSTTTKAVLAESLGSKLYEYRKALRRAQARLGNKKPKAAVEVAATPPAHPAKTAQPKHRGDRRQPQIHAQV